MKKAILSGRPSHSLRFIFTLRDFAAFTVIVLVGLSLFASSCPSVTIAIDPPSTDSNRALHELGLKCLRESNSPYGYSNIPYHSRADRDAEYRRILALTVEHRKHEPAIWLGWAGPWLEDLWIASYCCDRSIDEFGPFIPIFVPWVNVYRLHNFTKTGNNTYPTYIRPLFRALKPDFLYVTVNANDYGMEGMRTTNLDVPWNILIFSASGRGHIPILLHYKPQPPVDALPKKNDLIFLGKQDRPGRIRILESYRRHFGSRMTVARKVSDWITAYREHSLILSPRGNARGAFRTGEILQMGLIPILAFQKRLWVPYLNSSLPWHDIGFYTVNSQVQGFVRCVDALTPERLAFMRQTVRKYRESHFTIEATISQIAMFLKYGYEGSDLRCDFFYPGT
jgi:hypothetical protein